MASQSKTNPWERYSNSLASKTYAGSSGYWGDVGGSAARAYRAGMGYPGDAAKAQLANKAGVQLGGPAGDLQSRYRLPPAAGVGAAKGSASQYSPLEIVKSPQMAEATTKLLNDFNRGSADIPGFDELMKEQTRATTDIKGAYDREQQAYDLTGYSAEQRAADSAAAGLTADFANTSRDIGSRYAASDAEYARNLKDITDRAYSDLGRYDAAADAIGGEQVSRLLGQVSRYKMAGGNLGLGTDELRKIARGVGDIRLPLERDKIAQRYSVLTGIELPGEREIATREAARLAGFDLPLEQNIYGARAGDVLRGKATSQQLKQLEMSVASMSRAAAESYLKSLALPIEVIQAVLQRHGQTMGQRISNLGGIGQLEDQAYYRGLEYLPGSTQSQPAYYPLTLPNQTGNGIIPSRYNTSTGNTSAGPAYPEHIQRYLNSNSRAVPQPIAPLPARNEYVPSGGGFVAGPDGVSGAGNFRNFDFSSSYVPGSGFAPGQQAYYDALSERFQ